METLYAEEKFAQAEEELTFGKENIKGRVKSAYNHFLTVSPNDLPENLREDYQFVRKMLTEKAALKAQGSDTIVSSAVDQTLHFMRLKTAQNIAHKIVHIRRELKNYNDEHHRS